MSRIDEQRKYGYCVDNIVGRHLVDGGLADTRAEPIAIALRELFRAVSQCDERNLVILKNNFRWILEAANNFSNIERDWDTKHFGDPINKNYDEVLGGKND